MSGSDVGLVLLIFLALLILTWLNGCASMRQTCRYEAGELVEQETRSTVVGTGETDLATDGCTAIAYSTQDTGFSERVPVVVENISKGAMKGALEGLGIPSPSRVLR